MSPAECEAQQLVVTPSAHTLGHSHRTSILYGKEQTLRPIVKTVLATNSCGAMITRMAISPICSALETSIHKFAQSPCKWLKPNEASSDWCKPESECCGWVPFLRSLMRMRIWNKAENSGVLGINVLSWTGRPGQPRSLGHFISCCSVGAQSQKDCPDSA